MAQSGAEYVEQIQYAAAGRAKSRSLAPLRGLLPFLRPYRWTILAAVVAMLGAATAPLVLAEPSREPLNVLVVGMALAVGVLRHQVAIEKPPNHVVNALNAEPVLTRVAGRIVTTPIVRPPLLLNPFLPFNPPPRTQFVVALDELRTKVEATARVWSEHSERLRADEHAAD